MDTHVIAHLDLPGYAAPLMARLPDDPLDELVPETGHAAVLDGHPSSSTPKKGKGRAVLLAGAAALTIAAGGVAFLVSPYNRVYPLLHMASVVRPVATKIDVMPAVPLAPAATLASIALPPPPAPVVRQTYEGKPRRAQMDELLALQPSEHPEAARQDTASVHQALPSPDGPPPGYAAREPGSAPIPATPAPASPPTPTQPTAGTVLPHPATRDVTQSVIASIAQPERPVEPPAPPATPPHLQPANPPGVAAAAPASPPAPLVTPVTAQQVSAAAPASAPTATPPPKPDAAQIVLSWQPAPMTGPEQVQVLGLVTQMAAMVRDLKAQDAQLRSDFAKATADSNTRLTDFERRLELSEAQRAVTAAKDAGNAPVPVSASPASVPAVSDTAPPIVQVVTHIEPAASTGGPTTRYRVQAASPGLAMLAQIDRGGGDGAQIQVVVGDIVPGYGKVKSVAQHGLSWVVNTEHGVIGE